MSTACKRYSEVSFQDVDTLLNTECMYSTKLKKLLGGSSPVVYTRGHEGNSERLWMKAE
jgi:hypothetical protein